MTPRLAPLRIGTRGSPLALWQADRVGGRIAAAGRRQEYVRIETAGDLQRDTPLSRFGLQAVFSREIDQALLDGRIDLAVHSLKDLPTRLSAGISLAAVTEREDPSDALVGRGPLRWTDLPAGAVLATCSLRRRAQALRARPDLRIVEVRGNVGTRITELHRTPSWAGLILATAGLMRLGLADRISQRLPFDLMLPAPGQGAMGVTVRADDAATAGLVLGLVDDHPTNLCTAAERALLRRLEGGCQVPVAALATMVEGTAAPAVHLRARVVSLDGARMVEETAHEAVKTAADAERLGESLAERLLANGAGPILAEIRPAMEALSR
ncbi:MAG: hydroxymethylbilane synthase [Gemmatimonadales bacterium]